MTTILLNVGAFVLAAAASATTFGGAALLARHQYVVAERASVAAPALPTTTVAPRARRA